MQYTTTSQEIFETFCISKAHKKYLKIDEIETSLENIYSNSSKLIMNPLIFYMKIPF